MPVDWSKFEVKEPEKTGGNEWDAYEVKKKPLPSVSKSTVPSLPNGGIADQDSPVNTDLESKLNPKPADPFGIQQPMIGNSPAANPKDRELYYPGGQEVTVHGRAKPKQSYPTLDAIYKNLSPEEQRNFAPALDVATRVSDNGSIDAASPDKIAHQKLMDSNIGKILAPIAYVGSYATKAVNQMAKGAAVIGGLINPNMKAAYDNAFELSDPLTDMGLTKKDKDNVENMAIPKPIVQGEIGVGGALKALGQVANIMPSVAMGGASFALQGLGQGKEIVDELEKNGQKLNTEAKVALIGGSAVLNHLFMGDLGSVYGKLPSMLKNDILGSISMDAIKESAEKEISGDAFKELVQNKGMSFLQKAQQGGINFLTGYKHTLQGIGGYNIANFALKKGVDAINDKPVFNETLGNLAEQLDETATKTAPMFAAGGSIHSLTRLTPGSSYKNAVVESLKNDSTPENINKIKEDLYNHGFDQNKAGGQWTPEEMDATFKQIDNLAKITSSLPKGLADNKHAKAVDIINDRNELQTQLEKVQESKQILDPAIKDIPTPEEEMLTAKIGQANDKLNTLVKGGKVTYSKDEEKGKFYKTMPDGKRSEISPARYQLEDLERNSKTPSEPTVTVRENRTAENTPEPTIPNEPDNNSNTSSDDINENDSTDTVLGKAENRGGIYAQLANALKGALGNVKTIVTNTFKSDVSGHADYGDNTITINNKSQYDKLHLFFHEAMHHVTFEKLKEFESNPNSKNLTPDEIKAIINLKKIFKHVSEKVNQDRGGFGTQKKGVSSDNLWLLPTNESRGINVNDRGFANVHEFISEAFSNPEFQKLLSTFKSEGESPTIFKQFLGAVSKLLGLKDPTILDDIFHHAEKLVKKGNTNEETQPTQLGNEVKGVAEAVRPEEAGMPAEVNSTPNVEVSEPAVETPETKKQRAIDYISHGLIFNNESVYDARIDFGKLFSSSAEKAKAVSDIVKGNFETAPAKKMIEGTGGMTVRNRENPSSQEMRSLLAESKRYRLENPTPEDIVRFNEDFKNYDITPEELLAHQDYEERRYTTPETNGEANRNVSETLQSTGDAGGGNNGETTGSETVQGEQNREVSDKFTELVHKNIQSEEVRDTLSNTERETGRTLTNEESEYKATNRLAAVKHGKDVVDAAKEEFGNEYVAKLLDYLNEKTVSVENKSLITISLELDLERSILEQPENVATLEKQLKLVRDISIKQQRSAAIATGYGILRQIAQLNYDVNQVTSDFFSPKELQARSKTIKAVEATAEDIQKEAVSAEQQKIDLDQENLVTAENQRLQKENDYLRKAIEQASTKYKRTQKKSADSLKRVRTNIDASKKRFSQLIAGRANSLGILNPELYNELRKIVTGKVEELYIKTKTSIDLKTVVKEVLEELKDIAPDITDKDVRDAISGNYEKIAAKREINPVQENIKSVRKEAKDELKAENTPISEEKVPPTKEEIEQKEVDKEINSTQKSIEELERKLRDNELHPDKKQTSLWTKEIGDLKTKKQGLVDELAKRRKAESDANKPAPEPKPPLTPKERLANAKEAVKKRIENVREEIINKERELKTQGKVKPDAELLRLRAEEAAIKALRDKYLPKEEIGFKDEKKREQVANKLEEEIENLNRQIEAGEKDERAAKKDPAESEKINKLRAEKKARLDLLEDIDPQPENVVKDALIEAGFGKEITVTTKSGKEKRTILDWTKLTGVERSPENIRANVEEQLKNKGYSEAQINRMQNGLENEYQRLSESIIEKSLKELDNRNTPKEGVNTKSLARRLAQLYNYGLFNKQPDTYDYLLNQTLGTSIKDQEIFFQTKELHKSLAQLVSAKDINGKPLTDLALATLEQGIKVKIKMLIQQAEFNQGTRGFKASVIAKNTFGLLTRTLLNTVNQLVENPFSAKINDVQVNLQDSYNKVGDTKELKSQRVNQRLNIYNNINANEGEEYGGVGSPFSFRNDIDDAIKERIPKKEWAQIFYSVTTGNAFLGASDSAFKIAKVEQQFKNNLIEVLTDPKNPNGQMKPAEALQYVAESLTGQNFEDAKKTATQIVESINQSAGKEVIRNTPNNITRIANDIVKDALVNNGKISKELVESSFKAAYTTAGHGLGHEANNIISKSIGSINTSIEKELKDAIKNKDFKKAAFINMASILSKNFINPFAGGGANWTVLGLQKMGLPVQYLRSNTYGNKTLDLSTPLGLREVENVLETKATKSRADGRMVIGGVAGLLITAAVAGTKKDDEINKFLKEHPTFSKVLKKLLPPALMIYLAFTDKEKSNKQKLDVVGQLVGDRTNTYSDMKRSYKIGENYMSGNYDKAKGGLGELIGNRINFPFLSASIMTSVRDLHNEFIGNPVPQEGQSTTFASGFYKRGFAALVGLRPKDGIEMAAEQKSFSTYTVGKKKYEFNETQTKQVTDEYNKYIANPPKPYVRHAENLVVKSLAYKEKLQKLKSDWDNSTSMEEKKAAVKELRSEFLQKNIKDHAKEVAKKKVYIQNKGKLKVLVQ